MLFSIKFNIDVQNMNFQNNNERIQYGKMFPYQHYV